MVYMGRQHQVSAQKKRTKTLIVRKCIMDDDTILRDAIYDNQLLDCHFTRAFYKQILGKPVSWHDMQAVDEEQHKSLLWILSNSVEGLEMTMAMDTEKFGLVETRDLVKDGQNVAVTNDNKNLYVDLICNVKLVEAIKPQMEAFLKVRLLRFLP